jgi:hypothetical protein
VRAEMPMMGFAFAQPILQFRAEPPMPMNNAHFRAGRIEPY